MKDRFTVKCNTCGSEDVSIKQEYDYDYEDSLVGTGIYYLLCNNCGEISED